MKSFRWIWDVCWMICLIIGNPRYLYGYLSSACCQYILLQLILLHLINVAVWKLNQNNRIKSEETTRKWEWMKAKYKVQKKVNQWSELSWSKLMCTQFKTNHWQLFLLTSKSMFTASHDNFQITIVRQSTVCHMGSLWYILINTAFKYDLIIQQPLIHQIIYLKLRSILCCHTISFLDSVSVGHVGESTEESPFE